MKTILKRLVVLNRIFGIDFIADNKLILGTGPFLSTMQDTHILANVNK